MSTQVHEQTAQDGLCTLAEVYRTLLSAVCVFGSFVFDGHKVQAVCKWSLHWPKLTIATSAAIHQAEVYSIQH